MYSICILTHLYTMLHITRIAEADVLDRIDVAHIASKFSNLKEATVLVLVCTADTWRQEDTWRHKGETYQVVRLPYAAIKTAKDPLPLILEAVAKRLGVPTPTTANQAPLAG